MSRSEIEKFFSDDDDYKNTELLVGDDSLGIINDNNDDGDGQLSIDMYQTEKDVVVKAPVAGVKEENLEVSVTEDSISIKGHAIFAGIFTYPYIRRKRRTRSIARNAGGRTTGTLGITAGNTISSGRSSNS